MAVSGNPRLNSSRLPQSLAGEHVATELASLFEVLGGEHKKGVGDGPADLGRAGHYHHPEHHDVAERQEEEKEEGAQREKTPS